MLELNTYEDGLVTITKEVPFTHNVTGNTEYRKEQLAAVSPNKDGSIAIIGRGSSCTVSAETLPLLITALLKVSPR